MMIKKRLMALLLALVLLLSFAGCSAGSVDETTEAVGGSSLTEEEQKILSERRDTVEAYMREMATVLWRASETITYYRSTNDDRTNQLKIVAGRLYRGIPYSYSASAAATFMDILKEPDEKGIYQISEILNDPQYPENFAFGIYGNDCSGAVQQSWAQIGASVTFASTKNMASDYGFLPVGEYWTKTDDITNSAVICNTNGKDVMYAAYAQLQKADACVRRGDSSGHAIMVADVNVVYNDDGTINGADSKIIALEQTSNLQQGEKYYFDTTLEENVYTIYVLDKEYSFADLYNEGQLPVTCKELIDPSPVAEPKITDSLTEFNKDTVMSGTISSNWAMDKVKVVISDAGGNEVQRSSAVVKRRSNYAADLADTFADDNPAKQRVIGNVDVTKLVSGEYRCVLSCRLSTGEEYTVRDFTFTV